MFLFNSCFKTADTDSDNNDHVSPSVPSISSANKSGAKYTCLQNGLKDINFIKVLGKGSYGKVMLAEKKDTNELYAVKVVRKDAIIKDVIIDGVINEKHVMILTAGNPFFTSLLSYFQTSDRLFFVMEFESGGNLLFHLERSRTFEEKRTVFYAAETTLALQFLHRHAIIHRDLKLINVLLDRSGHCKLTDFGLSKVGIADDGKTSTYCGTPPYLAPEIINGMEYNKSVDWWALGILIFKMLTGKYPFNADNPDDLHDSIIHDDVVFPINLSRKAVSIVNGLLTKSPEHRLGHKDELEIQSHPFYSHLEWEALELRQIEPPFLPSILSDGDTTNFDMEIIRQEPVLTPISLNTIRSINQSEFAEFPWPY